MVGGADLEQVTEAQGKADNAARQSSDCHAAAMTAQTKSKGAMPLFCCQLFVTCSMARSQGLRETDASTLPPSTPGPRFCLGATRSCSAAASAAAPPFGHVVGVGEQGLHGGGHFGVAHLHDVVDVRASTARASGSATAAMPSASWVVTGLDHGLRPATRHRWWRGC